MEIVRGRILSAFVIFALGLLALASQGRAVAGADCVSIFHDRSKEPSYKDGELYATFLANLIGHFPGYKATIRAVEDYKKGQIEECRASFYIGSYFDNAIPKDFLDDFAKTTKSVAWLGYSSWQLGERLSEVFGTQYVRLTPLDTTHLDKFGRPTFYKFVKYKGETFEKHGEYDSSGKNFSADVEMSEMRVTSRFAKVLAEAVHNHSGARIPYAIQNGKKFFIADVPFAYMHEGDRYLVFADLLFDILGEEPLHDKKQAVFRFEDVHGKVSMSSVLKASKIAKRLNVPMHVALIPVFTDPHGHMSEPPVDSWLSLLDQPEFNATLSEIKKDGARFIWHGVTHQYGAHKNPNGSVGDDWEFWDYNQSSPVAEDSVDFVLNRLNTGWKSLIAAGIKPVIWEVPHYQASALDYFVFGQVFAWNIGRIGYQTHAVSGLNRPTRTMWFETTGVEGHDARLKALEELEVETTSSPHGQFFPYEIYSDVYGQKVLPENLGNVQAQDGRAKRLVRSVDDILRDARRNLVLRDVWGSFYYHPQLLESAEGEQDLERLLKTMQAMGYEFIDLEAFAQIRK